MSDDIIVTTMNDLPGYEVTEVFGEVFGLTVRSRHVGSDIGASLKGLIGGEVKGYTKMLRESREEFRYQAREGFTVVEKGQQIRIERTAQDPLVLRPSEGLHVQFLNGGTATSATVAFTVSIKAVLAEVTYP